MTLPDRPVLVCLGSGGVGKTTLAAAWGVAGALLGERVVVLTIDPARRLAGALGMGSGHRDEAEQGQIIGNEPTLVQGPWSGELWAAMLDPTETLTRLLTEHGTDEQVARVTGNRLFANIVGSMSGTNEYMAAERLFQLYNDTRFDRVVIDTPPSRHALDFLDSPARLTRFIDNRLYRAVFVPRRGLARSVNSAAQVILRLTARLVGADLVDDVIRLFRDLEGLDRGFHQRAVETAALLKGSDCGYALITSPRYEPLREAEWIQEGLAERGHRLDVVVVNRLTPFGRTTPTSISSPDWSQRTALADNWRQLSTLARSEDELINKLVLQLPADLPVILVDEQIDPVTSVDGLVELAAQL